MRVRNLSLRLLLPVVLMALVLALAVLQYQWLGKVSEAERAQLLRSLTQRAREFAEDFDDEMTLAYRAHQVSRDAVTANRFDALVESISRWRGAAKFPQMVRAVYLAERADDKYTLRAFNHDRRAFEASPLTGWPAHLEPVRTQLVGTAVRPDPQTGGKTQFFSISLMTVLPDVPALVVPVPNQGLPAGLTEVASTTPPIRNSMIWMRAIDACIVVDLDAAYLKTTVLPTMAARHFPDLGANGYRMAVVSASGATLFARDVPDGQVLSPDRADVTQSVFSVRPDLLQGGPAGGNTLIVRSFVTPNADSISPASSALPAPPGAADRVSVLVEQRSTPAIGAPAATIPPGATSGGSSSGQFRIVLPAWRVVLQHQSGSLDAAVSQARRRNLLLSFGILGILTAGVVIVIVNARRAEQLAARRMDFVATVSHELRTPLAVIRSAAQNLSAGVIADPAHARRYGELIDGEGRRLTDMVEQVMTLAGLESRKPLQGTREIDIPALITDVVASRRALCDAAGITLEVNTGLVGSILMVKADEAALRRALQNLVTNAVKHAADGRWIGVTVSALIGRRGREIQIDVSDRGRGIDAADLAHVFEPFHRGRHAIEQQVHGNGLGLHLVTLIATAHGGRVSVRSTPGHGATFTLHLPAANGKPLSE